MERCNGWTCASIAPKLEILWLSSQSPVLFSKLPSSSLALSCSRNGSKKLRNQVIQPIEFPNNSSWLLCVELQGSSHYFTLLHPQWLHFPRCLQLWSSAIYLNCQMHCTYVTPVSLLTALTYIINKLLLNNNVLHKNATQINPNSW